MLTAGHLAAGWHAVHGEVMIKANHWMVSENVIDMAHVPYVHKGTVGNHAAFVDIIIEHMPTAMNFSFPIESHHDEGQKASFKVDTMATMCLPSTSFIRFTFPGNFRMVTINSVVPIDEEHTCIRFCQMRNFLRNGLVDPLIQKCAFVCLRTCQPAGSTSHIFARKQNGPMHI